MNSRLTRIVVAGQFPPPIGGQNIAIQSLFEELSSSESYQVHHLRFAFSPSFKGLRKASLHKIVEVVRVWLRIVRLRLSGPIDLLWYPSGGPQTVPILRDIALLPVLTLLSRRSVMHFHAAGFADQLADHRNIFATVLAWICRRCVDGAIVMTPYNCRDPESLGISDVAVFPHRLPDRNPAATGDHSTPGLNFLYAGHLYDLKGTPQLITAFCEVNRAYPDSRLILLGAFMEPYSEEQCREQIAGLGLTDHVEVAGEVQGTAKDKFFADADCFVFPTVAPYESFGLVLIEAMMWRLPIVATKWRGNHEVMGDPPGGIVFPVNGPLASSIQNALREAIERHAEWDAWGSANRDRYVREFSEKPGDRFGNFVRQIVSTS